MHEALGAAGSGKGVDYVYPNLVIELKTLWGPYSGDLFTVEMMMGKAEGQTLRAQQQIVQGGLGLPDRGQAVLFIDAYTGQINIAAWRAP